MTPPPTGLASLFLGATLLFGLAACQPEAGAGGESDSESGAPPVVEVTAVDYAFQAPDSIPSGWVTFRMTNKGEESHHLRLDRLPDGRTYEEFHEVHIAPRDSLERLLAAGEIDTAELASALDRIPDWAQFDNLEKRGGVGLVTPGQAGQATFELEPGTYFMYCVILAPNERFHAEFGMRRPIVVTEEASGESAPEPDAWVKSSGHDLSTEGRLAPGSRTVGFRAGELPEGLSEGTSGAFSAWLARLGAGTDLKEVLQWNGQNPAPAEFLGGFEYVPPSRTAYMTADLKPGHYAWLWFYYGEDEPFGEEFTVE